MTITDNTTETCPLCNGMEWVVLSERGAQRCRCYHRKRGLRMWQEAGIPSRYQSCSFESFEVGKDGASLGKAKKIVFRFADAYPITEEGKGLLILGPCGVGKTHLAVALIRVLIREKSAPCLFIDHRDLIRKIQDCYAHNAENTVLEVLSPVINAEILVLDELGAGKTTAWVKETITHIIGSRYNEKRVCIFTSNYQDKIVRPGEESLTERIGERLRSRLYEMCRMVEIQGEDFRKKEKKDSASSIGIIRA